MTGGRPILPGPATTDVVGRLWALSPGDRVTSCLPCRAPCSSGQPGPTSALTSEQAKCQYETYIPPRRQAPLLRRPGFPASQRNRHTISAVPAPEHGVARRTERPLRAPSLITAPRSGLVAVRRAVPQVAERRLGLAPGLAVPQVLQRFARLAARVAVPQVLKRLPGLASRLALAQVADGRLGLAPDLALPQVADGGFRLAPGLALPEVLQGRLGLAAPFGGLPAAQPGGQLDPPRP